MAAPGAPAAAELFEHLAQRLREDIERSPERDSALRAAIMRVARAGAAARASNNPRAAVAMLDGAWLRCRDTRERSELVAEAERLHAAAVAASTFATAALDAWPDAGIVPSAISTLLRGPRGESGMLPVIYERAVTDWPAVTRWRLPAYWIAQIGARVVPVEVGIEHRESDLAQQRLMPFGEYVDSVLLPLAHGEASTLGRGDCAAVSAVVPVTSARTVAYLAQHPLLEQCSARSCQGMPLCHALSRTAWLMGRALSEGSSPSFPPGSHPVAPLRLCTTTATRTTSVTWLEENWCTCGPRTRRSRATRRRRRIRRRSTPPPSSTRASSTRTFGREMCSTFPRGGGIMSQRL